MYFAPLVQILVILAWMVDELWCGQAQNGVNFDFDLKTIGTLTKVFCIFGPNLVILAWPVDELSRSLTNLVTDGLTDRRRQRQYPEAKLASGKNIFHFVLHQCVKSRAQQSVGINFPTTKSIQPMPNMRCLASFEFPPML